MSKHRYCPYCGATQWPTNVVCAKCKKPMTLIQSKYDSEYYREKSLAEYGDYTHWYEYLLPEIKESPLFDEALFNYKQTEADRKEILDKIFDEKLQNQNIPKCPTCGSTNIKKISTSAKAVGAIAFGLLSKTARSQFKCGSCGYKW